MRALAVLRKALPKGAPVHPGGGTARLFAPGWVIWSEAPDRFEAGTPAIINIIALALALQEKRRNGDVNFNHFKSTQGSVQEIGYNVGTETVVLTSVLEHSSNDLPWRTITNGTVLRLTVDKEGFYDLNELERLLQEYNSEKKYGEMRIRLVALNGASNVLGTCRKRRNRGTIWLSLLAYSRQTHCWRGAIFGTISVADTSTFQETSASRCNKGKFWHWQQQRGC